MEALTYFINDLPKTIYNMAGRYAVSSRSAAVEGVTSIVTTNIPSWSFGYLLFAGDGTLDSCPASSLAPIMVADNRVCALRFGARLG